MTAMTKEDWFAIREAAIEEARAADTTMYGAERNWRIAAKVNQFFGIGNGTDDEDEEA